MTASLPFIEVNLNLSFEQINMLIKGLKYILPCQYRFSKKSVDEIVLEQYENMSNVINNCLRDHRISTIDDRAKQAYDALKILLKSLYSKPLPKKLAKRAKYEYQLVKSIKNLLHQRLDIVVRRTDKSKVFYIGKASEIEHKTQEYMLKTKAYEEITDGHCPLNENFLAVKRLLDDFVLNKVITPRQRNRLLPNINKLELAHFHALPKPHKPGTPIRPIIASMNAPTTLVSKFLNDLLAPIYLHVARETTFVNGIDLIRKLDKYTRSGYLRSITKFITMDVTDLYTMIPRDGALEALARFCIKYSINHRIGSLTIDHIMKMARLILDNNTFAYGNKYYRQIRGGAMGSAFTQVLANIYMLEWEQNLIQFQSLRKEIYGRYIDDIFMTTNMSEEEISRLLEMQNSKDINIKINYEISNTVHFLDVSIHNINGSLRTLLYHKSAAEPYILPYTSDHPIHVKRNIPFAALMRAIRMCSTIDDFEIEFHNITVSLLLNEYPPWFLDDIYIKFFRIHNASDMLHRRDYDSYRFLHMKLVHQQTKRETIACMTYDEAVRNPPALKQNIWNDMIMYPRYMQDLVVSKNLKKRFMHWWNLYYGNIINKCSQVKVRLVPTTLQTLEAHLIRKKPKKTILNGIQTKETCSPIC